jgi:YbgC/YbaW family acyl-CoA thioester hydrolase
MLKTFSYSRFANFYETDAAKIVHFSNYFKYVEEAELEFIASFSELDCSEEVWMRSDFSCEYSMPIRFDEEFRVELVVIAADPNSINYEFCIYTENSVAAKGSYNVKSLSFSDSTKRFQEQEINQQLLSAING